MPSLIARLISPFVGWRLLGTSSDYLKGRRDFVEILVGRRREVAFKNHPCMHLERPREATPQRSKE